MKSAFHGPVSQVLRIYHEIDRRVDRFKKATGLACPPGCGTCCESQDVEATLLEVLPLAWEIYREGLGEEIIGLTEERTAVDNWTCAAFRCHDKPASDTGCCDYYDFRPLLCRLFGFAARRDKYGRREFSTCRILKATSPFAVQRAAIAVTSGLDVPVYQECHMQVATVDPGLGFRRLPINTALKQAIEFLHWRRPKRRPIRKAA